MRAALLLSLTLFVTVLSGCSDPPPSGEFSSSGSAVMVSGSMAATHTAFDNPYDQSSGTELECMQDQLDSNVPVDRCTRPSTELNLNFSDLPDPQTMTYMAYFIDSTGTNADEEIDMLQNVHEMGGAFMGELMWDNKDACKASNDDAACKKDVKYDYVQIRLGDTPVARAAIGGGDFEVDPALMGVSFSGSYEGKKLLVDVSGLDANMTYTGWLVSTDETGATSHDESFTVQNGANEFEATMNVNKFSDFHIHVTGTKLNVATGSL